MRPLAYITLAFAPLIAFGIYWYFRNRYDASFRKLLIKSFVAGAFMIIILAFVQFLSTILGLNDLRSLKRTLFYAFLTIGFTSEFCKFVVLRYIILPKKIIAKPIHAITFSIMIALGLVMMRLILFFLNPFPTESLHAPPTLFPFIAVPASIMFAVILGFFIGMSKFVKTRSFYSFTGLMVAAFFNGLFNFCLIANDFKLLSLFAFGATILVFILGLKAAYTDPESLQ